MKTKHFWKELLQCSALLFPCGAYLMKGKNIVNHVVFSYVLNLHFSVSGLSAKTWSCEGDFQLSLFGKYLSYLIFAV